MNTFMNALEAQYNYKFTENGALAHRSSGSKVYDLFALGGAYRSRSIEDVILLFQNAFDEDPDLALKCLFYLRDCRGGQGERRFFRICIKWLAQKHPVAIIPLIRYIPEYGRYDDWFELLDTYVAEDVLKQVVAQLTLDMKDAMDNKAISLLGKWLPSENTSSKETKRKAKIVREYLQATPKEYRKLLSSLREHIRVLEKLMSENRWNEIEFDKIPSKAGLIYRNAFARRDLLAEKYEKFMNDENTKVNAKTLYPYEVVEKAIDGMGWQYNWDDGRTIDITMNKTERAAINKYWENLPDYLNGASPSMLCVIDTSGSMQGRPINVAISLGLYAAERMTGPFAGKYISFASRPQLIKTEGIDFVDKVRRIYQTNLVDDTNLTAVFDLLLRTAVKEGVKREDIPKTITVISDMEINYGSNWDSENEVKTEMEKIRDKWNFYGIEMPRLVYWNVNARHDTILDLGPNVSLVSGCSPILYEMILTGKQGFDLMLNKLLSDRYKVIKM